MITGECSRVRIVGFIKVQGVHSLFTTFQVHAKRRLYEIHRLVFFTWKNSSSKSVYLNVNAIWASQNVRTVLKFTSRVSRRRVCHRDSWIFYSCTKFYFTTIILDGIPGHLHSRKRRNPVVLYRRCEKGRDYAFSLSPSSRKNCIQRVSL
jgi:hypothetical protein